MEELKNMYQNNTLETNQKIIASNWSEMSDEHKSLYFPHGSLEVQHEHHHHQQQQHPQVHQLQQHHHIQQQFQQVQQHQRHQQIQIPMHNGNNLNVHDVMSITLDHNSKAFMIFSTEKHDEVQSMYPRADYSELHNILTQTWNGLSQSEKMVRYSVYLFILIYFPVLYSFCT